MTKGGQRASTDAAFHNNHKTQLLLFLSLSQSLMRSYTITVIDLHKRKELARGKQVQSRTN